MSSASPSPPIPDGLPSRAAGLASPPHDDSAGEDGEIAAHGPGFPWVAVLSGLVLFLIALILVVFAGRQWGPEVLATVRTWVERDPQADWKAAVSRLSTGSPAGRLAAARLLVAQGPDAVIAALDATNPGAAGNSVNFNPPVARVFAEVGADAVPVLIAATACEKQNVRTAAVGVLREMGAAAEPAVLVLAHLVKDENRYVQGFACDTLGNIGSKAAAAVDALRDIAEHPDPVFRRKAIVALGRIGPAARDAIPTLKRLRSSDADKDTREAAVVALNEIDLAGMMKEANRQADSEVRELIRRLQEPDESEAVFAARTLGRRGADAKAAVPFLAQALASKNKWLREAAAEALGLMGADAKSVAPALQRATEDKENEVREAAQKALDKIGA